jgi:hypothetical protein
MARKPVVEPAGNSAFPDAKSVEKADKSDTLFFPHVDSCLAMIFVLEDDGVVGAHVGAFSGDQYQPDANARAAVLQMKQLTGGKRVLEVFTLGDGTYTRANFLGDVSDKPVIVNADTDGGFDITADPTLRTITAVSCRDGSKKFEWKFSELDKGQKFI